jgi:hypothetical protein
MSRVASALLALFVLTAMPFALPRVASACGGCFAPTGTPNIVTAHRMAVSLSASETTLWDQIQYAGAPEDFVWVLPVSAGVEVELADNAFFEALAQGTQINMTAPLPPTPCFCSSGGFGCGASDSASPATRGGGVIALDAGAVTVFHEGSIGPYETATVMSDDAMALVDWLQERGYGVPDSILPTIAHYSELGLAFVVLRLSPDAGVQQMQPVRITVPGLAPTFPLRMVAAGATEELSLELYVFAEGRTQTMNMPTVEVDRAQITFDWATSTFDYDARFDAAIREVGGRAWVAEYAGPLPANVPSYSSRDPDGTLHTAEADLAVARRGLRSALNLTKLRTRMPPNLLDRDLVLGAAFTEQEIPTQISVTRELNRGPDPDCSAECGDGPSDFDGCSVHDAEHAPRNARDRGLPLGLALLLVPAIALLRRRRARR